MSRGHSFGPALDYDRYLKRSSQRARRRQSPHAAGDCSTYTRDQRVDAERVRRAAPRAHGRLGRLRVPPSKRARGRDERHPRKDPHAARRTHAGRHASHPQPASDHPRPLGGEQRGLRLRQPLGLPRTGAQTPRRGTHLSPKVREQARSAAMRALHELSHRRLPTTALRDGGITRAEVTTGSDAGPSRTSRLTQREGFVRKRVPWSAVDASHMIDALHYLT